MKSKKCAACGFVGWSDAEYCKACGAHLGVHSDQWDQSEGPKSGLAIVALILGIVSFFTLGLLGVGAITGIVLACVAMGRVKREPWRYGGRGMAIAGLVLSITSLVSLVPVAIIAAIAIPNLLAARIAANEASAIRALRQISSAEVIYYTTFSKYGTLNELAAERLIDSKLATGSKDGYKFSVELTTDESNVEGFAVVGVPAEYRSSGRRSFYIDESNVLRAADNHGRPPTKMDDPLDVESEYPSKARRVEYRQEPVY